MRIFHTLSLLVYVSLLGSPLWSDEVYFTSHPSVSPDGATVVFSFEGDLWKVPVTGGTASRITAMEGEETHPRFSPDGRWIAFTGRQEGNAQVYVMPVEGGDIRRLTYYQGNNLVNSWSWDSRTIYFASDRYNYISSYAVSVQGGTPHRLFGHFFNLPHDIVQHPVTDAYYFTDTWESFYSVKRKRYRGSFRPDIKSYNPQTDEFIVHTDWEGKDLWPLFDRQGNLYFVSDEKNGEYNLFRLAEGGKISLTDLESSIKRPQISADGSTIVFELGYRLYRYDTATGEVSLIPISLARNFTLDYDQEYNVEGKITSFDVSPDNKKFAFVSRGALFVSDIEGKYIRRLPADPMERVVEARWLADSKTLVYTQTAGGFSNIFTISGEGRSAGTRITDHAMNDRNLTLNPARDRLAYFSGRNSVQLMDLKTFASVQVLEDELWSFYNNSLRFSPDGRYLSLNVYRNFERDILICDLRGESRINITNTGVTELDPFWSPDGKYLYFATDRFRPLYPRGNIEMDIYRIAFDKYPDPSRSEKFDRLFAEEDEENKEPEKKASDVRVSISFDGLDERWERVTRFGSSQYSPYVLTEGEQHTVLFISDHDGSDRSIWKTVLKPFEEPKTEKIKNAATGSMQIAEADGKLYALIGGTVHKLNLSPAEAEKIEMTFPFRRHLAAEFRQMFFETWANLDENFYDPEMHGVDWTAMRRRYETFLPHLNSRSDFRRLSNDLLGELNSSHMGFASTGEEEKTVYGSKTNTTGIIFEDDPPYTVNRIVRLSPADKKGIDIQPGDVLTSVNGVPVDPGENRERYFSSPAMQQEMELGFTRGSTVNTVRVVPESVSTLQQHLYDEWRRLNRTKVDERSDKRIAYIHMKNMSASALEEFQIEITRQLAHSSGLILDLRYNRGGNVHDDVLRMLSGRTYLRWNIRDGHPVSQPNFAPADKPIVLLINEQSLSDAEMTAEGFKRLGLGKVLGTETYRWIIFTTGMQLVDGSFHRLPAWGCYTLDGENLELTGVSPDIFVQNTFKDRLTDNDPQLDRAVDEILMMIR